MEQDVEIAEKLWMNLAEACKEKNTFLCLQRIKNNSEMLSALMESNNIISEARKAVQTVKNANKKLTLATHNTTIDNALVFIFLKGLTTLPTKTEAFKLSLIDKDGRLLRQPSSKEEKDSISNLDLLMFKIRKWLMSRMSYLSSISWIKGAMNNARLQNMFSNAETVSRQYCVRKINDELDKILKFD